MSSNDIELFFDTSSNALKPVSQLQVSHDLCSEYPPFDWQGSEKNAAHARIFMEEGNLAEDSGEEIIRASKLPIINKLVKKSGIKIRPHRSQQNIKGLSPKSSQNLNQEIKMNESLLVLTPNKQNLVDNDSLMIDSYQADKNQNISEILGLESNTKQDIQLQRIQSREFNYDNFLYEQVPLSYNNKYSEANSKLSFWLVQDLKHAHSDSIWTAKFSPCGKYLATGGKDATLKIWEIQNDDYVLQLLNNVPVWELREHALDIIDISWHANSQMILSCSFDQKVILWSLDAAQQKKNGVSPMIIFEHPDVASGVCFFKGIQTNYFVTGALDGGLRVWNILKKSSTPLQIERISDPISALQFSPNGKLLVVGLITGMCIIYDVIDKNLNYKSRIDCKNRNGRFSAGRKISGITFITEHEFLCQTADSRLRLYSQVDCIQKLKLKSHMCEHLQICPDFNSETNIVISGSEDGFVYLWDRRESCQITSANECHYIYKKQRGCAKFTPFLSKEKNATKTIANVVLFCPQFVVDKAKSTSRKVLGTSSVQSVILVASIDGRLKLYWSEEKQIEVKGFQINN